MDVMETAQQVATAPKTDKLAGRVAFVTVGSRGIGAAIARASLLRVRRLPSAIVPADELKCASFATFRYRS